MTQFKIQPLGGLAQIGSNMISVKFSNEHIIIDSGILFPNDDGFGINYLIPNFYKMDSPPTHLIITHGHEDHIGAIHHMIAEFPKIELWATPFAAELIRSKLDYRGLKHPIRIYNESHQFEFNHFTINPIQMNHSIPETMGLLFGDKKIKNCFFYASDFKVDKLTPYEPYFNFKKLNKISQKFQYRTLFSDSTNILSQQTKTLSEFDLIEPLNKILKSNFKRFFITTFSSNIHRLETIFSLALKNQLKVVLYGRSSKKYVEVAQKCGLLNFSSSLFIDAKVVKNERVLVLASGCQGDFRSAFRRIATGNDTFFKPKKGDCFILSSKAIPGNEKKITNLINEITFREGVVYTSSEEVIHASGHPGKEDLSILIKEFNPSLIIPIHGEIYFLKKHAEYIQKEFGVTVETIFNFDTIFLDKDYRIQRADSSDQELTPLLIHGDDIVIEKENISQRRKLSENGSIFISVFKNKKFIITSLGLPSLFTNTLFSNFENLIKRNLGNDKETLRIECRKYLNSKLGYKPIVTIHKEET